MNDSSLSLVYDVGLHLHAYVVVELKNLYRVFGNESSHILLLGCILLHHYQLCYVYYLDYGQYTDLAFVVVVVVSVVVGVLVGVDNLELFVYDDAGLGFVSVFDCDSLSNVVPSKSKYIQNIKTRFLFSILS